MYKDEKGQKQGDCACPKRLHQKVYAYWKGAWV